MQYKLICFDSCCMSDLMSISSGTLYSAIDGKPIKFTRERMEALLAGTGANILMPAPVYLEVSLVSGAVPKDVDDFMDESGNFVIAPYDVRAAVINSDNERPTFIKDANKTRDHIKFDRQIVAIAKSKGADLLVTTDKGVLSDCKRYGVPAKCLSELDLPQKLRQQSLDLAVDNTKNNKPA